jgi:hypothetical protein
MSERRFDQAFVEWRKRRSQGRPAQSLERTLLREFRAAWAGGDEDAKRGVLAFLMHVAPPGGEDIVWESIQSDARMGLADGLAAALGYVRREDVKPPDAAVSALRRLVEDEGSNLRLLALHVLGRTSASGLESWLAQLAQSDPSDEIRREANIILMRRGVLPAKAALLAYLQVHPDSFGVADDLWREREMLALTVDEELQLREVMSRYVVWLRARLRDPDRATRYMAVSMLGGFVRDGFAFEEDDVEAVGDLAAWPGDTDLRLNALETLAAFDASAARRRLAELASSGRPRKVADRARRLLCNMS